MFKLECSSVYIHTLKSLIKSAHSNNYIVMIEKNIFQSWYTRIVPEQIQRRIDAMKLANAEYAYHLYTDEDMDLFVNENFQGKIADCYNRLNIIVAKVDFWRYLVLYKYGGVYLDMDSSINLPLRDLIKDEDDAILTAEGNLTFFVQWALVFKKGHPILKKVIDMIVTNIETNAYPNDIHKMTGPTVFTKAIQMVHLLLHDELLFVHQKITKDTDISYKKNDISYRIYGIDYSGYFSFSYPESNLLFVGKEKWTDVQKRVQLLRGN